MKILVGKHTIAQRHIYKTEYMLGNMGLERENDICKFGAHEHISIHSLSLLSSVKDFPFMR